MSPLLDGPIHEHFWRSDLDLLGTIAIYIFVELRSVTHL